MLKKIEHFILFLAEEIINLMKECPLKVLQTRRLILVEFCLNLSYRTINPTLFIIDVCVVKSIPHNHLKVKFSLNSSRIIKILDTTHFCVLKVIRNLNLSSTEESIYWPIGRIKIPVNKAIPHNHLKTECSLNLS